MKPVLFNFSGVYLEEGFPEALASEGVPYEWMDMTGIEGACCYCDEEAARKIRARVARTEVHTVHWIDSGDYHYMTKFFTERLSGPYTLVLVDHHADSQVPVFPGVLSCGGWVRTLQEEDARLLGVIAIGPGGRTERIGAPQEDGPVYLSLDKDVLSREDARTNWSQGSYRLSEVMEVLAPYVRNVSGVDVCGELAASKGGRPEDMAVNLRTNLALLHFFQKKIANFGKLNFPL